MGLFDRFRKPKDAGQVSMEARAAAPSGPVPASGDAFRMPVSDVFSLGGNGVVVVGQVAAGSCRSGDTVVVVAADGASMTGEATIGGIEAFRKRVDVARQGDTVGLMVRGLSGEQVHAGDVIAVRR